MNEKVTTKEIIKFIYEVLKPYKTSLYVMLFVAFIWPIDLSMRPYVLKLIIDKLSSLVTGENVFESVGYLAILFFLLNFTLSLSFRLYDYFVLIKMIPNIRKSIALNSFSLLLKQNYSYYQNNFSGSLTNKIKDLISAIPDITQIVLDRFLSHFLALFIAIVTLWSVGPIFALGMGSWAGFVIICSIFLSKKLSMLGDSWAEYASVTTGKLVDSLSNILSVHLFARSKKELHIIEEASDFATKAEQKFQWVFFWLWFGYGFSFVLVQAINLYFLIESRQAGLITNGDFVVVLSINMAIGDCLWQLAKEFDRFSELWGKIIQSLRTLKVIPEIEDNPDAKILKVTKGNITFDNVKFHYKGTDPLFENKSIEILSGQKVGLVGYSGSGKSTFVNLILRLFDVSDGKILIDGQDIRDVTQESLRMEISMIPQEPSLFHRPMRENIRYGKIDASDKDVINAAIRAHAHEFIDKLPEGYDSMVGERGIRLSGGQRQRIAIARAVLKNAPILILDEATSQLDSITESYIQDSLWDLMQGKTALVIAHRLSTLLHMDRILVFDKGKIVADGTHEELLVKKGLYKILWDAQVGGFLPEEKE